MSSGNSVMQLREGSGWSRGLNNVLRAELDGWFGTNQWWIQVLIWVAIADGILFAVSMQEDVPGLEAVSILNIMLGMATAVGVCILMQEAVVGEKQNGTAAWILSKPASRQSFLLAKVLANMAGIAVTMVAVPGLVGYLIISLTSGQAPPPAGFVAGLGVHLVNLFFYLALTLMLGAMSDHRGPVIGLSLAFLFGQQYLPGLYAGLIDVLPLTLTMPPSGSEQPAMATALMTGAQPATYLPLIATLVLSALFVAIAFWVFQRQEL